MKSEKTLVALVGLLAFAVTALAQQQSEQPASLVTNNLEAVYQEAPAEPAFAQGEQTVEVTPATEDAMAPSETESAVAETTENAWQVDETAVLAANATEPEPLEGQSAPEMGEAVTDDATAEATPVTDVEAPADEAAVESEAMTEAVTEEVDVIETDTDVSEAAEEAEMAEEAIIEDGDIIIPLIVMDEVPLMDAIRNLARQAEVNYMVDPMVPHGQVGPDGKVQPQPVLSIRWENVTAEQALLAVLNNYNLQLAEDPKTKILRISIRDPEAPDPLVTKIIQLDYASPSNVVDAVRTSFTDKRSKVIADVRTSQIVVVATEQEHVSVEEMVAKLDTPTRQVLIESQIIETTANPETVKGIDWSGTLLDQQFTFGNDPLGTGNIFWDSVNGFGGPPETWFLSADGLSATLSFLNESADSKSIATPRTVTLDNEPARLEVTRAYPIFKNTAGTQGSPGGSEVTYTNLGVILNVTPRISANDTINLRVVPEVSDVFETIEKVVAGTVNEADVYDIRRIETRVLIPSGNTLVMGGLLKDREGSKNIKVPLLGDIPVLGLVFRQDAKERDKVNLLVFITPTIVQDSDFQPTTTDFLQTKAPEYDDTEWSWWDSGKPAHRIRNEPDWSAR